MGAESALQHVQSTVARSVVCSRGHADTQTRRNADGHSVEVIGAVVVPAGPLESASGHLAGVVDAVLAVPLHGGLVERRVRVAGAARVRDVGALGARCHWLRVGGDRRARRRGGSTEVRWLDVVVDCSTLGEQPLGMPTLDSSAFQLGLRIQAEGFDVSNALVGEGIDNPEESELGQERLQRCAAC